MNRSGLIFALFVTVGAGLILGLFPAIDLWFAQLFNEIANPNHKVFVLGQSSSTLLFRRIASFCVIVLFAAPLFALAIKLFRPLTKMIISGNAIVFLIGSFLLAPALLVNVGLKDNWGRPRPGHISQFGGKLHFVAWWDPRGECLKNCSYVSGEIAAAYWTLAPAALAPLQWRALAYSVAFMFGTGVAVLRMMAGGHFVSDAIFSGVTTFLIIWLMYALIYRWRSTRLEDEKIEQALERFSIYCGYVVRKLGRRDPDKIT